MNTSLKKLLNLLIGGSFIFLVIYLIKQEYIIPAIENLPYLLISFLFLFCGFVAQAYSWKVALAVHGYPTRLQDAVFSHGLPVFTKYIPGKIWVILGRAGLLSANKNEMKKKSVISFKEQLIYLWVGFLISSIPTIIFYKAQWISFLVLFIVVCLTLFLFVPAIHQWIIGLFKRIVKKELDVPTINFKTSMPLVFAVTLVWIFWILGFYIFMLAFSNDIAFIMMFAFPLSVSLGLIAIFLPGGLGLREGIIIGYLTLSGLDIEMATTISFMNRFWFIGGEIFIFLTASIIRFASKGSSSLK